MGFLLNEKTADLPGGLSGSLCRFSCHWQRTLKLYYIQNFCQVKGGHLDISYKEIATIYGILYIR